MPAYSCSSHQSNATTATAKQPNKPIDPTEQTSDGLATCVLQYFAVTVADHT